MGACAWLALDAPAHATPPTPGPVVSAEYEADGAIQYPGTWSGFGAVGAGDNFLVLWSEYRSSYATMDLRGARIRASDGVLLDPVGFPVFEATKPQTNVYEFATGCRADGTQCLVAVSVNSTGNFVDSYYRVDPRTGTNLDPQGRVFSPQEQHSPYGVGVAPLYWSYAVLDASVSATSSMRLHLIQGTDGVESNSFVLLPHTNQVHPDPRIAAVDARMLMMWQGDTCVATLRDVSSPTVSVADIQLSTAACGQYDVGAVGGVFVVAWNDAVAKATEVVRVRPSDGAVLDSPPLALPGSPGAKVRIVVDDTAAVILGGTSARLDPTTGTLTSPAGTGSAGANGGRLLQIARASTSPYPIEMRRVQDDGTPIDTTPLINPQTTVSEVGPSVACGVDQCLAVWSELEDSPLGGGPTPWRLRAARLTPGGASLDPAGITISAENAPGQTPAVAFDGAGYVIIWENATEQLRAARIRASDGAVVAGPADLGVAADSPNIAVVGTTAIVGYKNRSSINSSDYQILPIAVASVSPLAAPLVIAPYGVAGTTMASDGTTALLAWQGAFVRIDANGALRDAAPRLLPGGPYYGMPSSTFDGTNFVLAWNSYGTTVAIRVRPSDGAVLDPTPVAVAATAGDPHLAFDGSSILVSWSESTSGAYGDTGTRGRRMRSGPGGLVPLEFASFPIVPDTGFAWALLWSTATAAPRGGPFLVAQGRLDNAPPYDSHRVRYRWVSADALGTACSSISTCTSGYCVDGVCCDSSCGDGDPNDCLACSAPAGAASPGHCGAKQVAACMPPADAGADVVGPDASMADAGQSTNDGGLEADAGNVAPTNDAAVNGETFVGGGCDCETARAASNAGSGATSALLAVALLARRRRTRRVPQSRTFPRPTSLRPPHPPGTAFSASCIACEASTTLATAKMIASNAACATIADSTRPRRRTRSPKNTPSTKV